MNGRKQPDLPAKGQFLVYQAEDGQVKIDVRLQGETAWLTQAHMAELFQTSISNVNMHFRNVFAEWELQPDSVIQESLITAADGKKYRTNHYNLDAIISVGYRVKSAVATKPHMGRTTWRGAKVRKEDVANAKNYLNEPELAEAEYDKFNRQRVQEADAAGGEFEKAIQKPPPPPKPKKKGGKQ